MIPRVNRSRRLFTILLLVMVAAASTACRKQEKDAKPTVAPLSDTTLERHVDLQVSGAVSAEFKARRDVRLVLREATGSSTTTAVSSTTFPSLIDLPDGRKLNFEFGVTGLYRGDGDYTVPAGIGQVPRTGPTVKEPPTGIVTVSVIQLGFIDKDKTSEERYNYLLEPCTLTLKDDGKEGSAKCPAIVAPADGKQITLDFKWGT